MSGEEKEPGAAKGPTMGIGRIPQNLEAILKNAAINPDFRERLVDERSALIDEMKLPLDPEERALLDAVEEKQLQTIIQSLKVPEEQRSVLLAVGVAAGAGAAILALLALLTASGSSIRSQFGTITGTLGIRPDGTRIEPGPARPPTVPVSAPDSSKKD